MRHYYCVTTPPSPGTDPHAEPQTSPLVPAQPPPVPPATSEPAAAPGVPAAAPGEPAAAPGVPAGRLPAAGLPTGNGAVPGTTAPAAVGLLATSRVSTAARLPLPAATCQSWRIAARGLRPAPGRPAHRRRHPWRRCLGRAGPDLHLRPVSRDRTVGERERGDRRPGADIVWPLLGFVAFVLVFSLVLNYVYEVEMMFRTGQTVGKRIMKIRVIPVDPAQTLTRGDAARRVPGPARAHRSCRAQLGGRAVPALGQAVPAVPPRQVRQNARH